MRELIEGLEHLRGPGVSPGCAGRVDPSDPDGWHLLWGHYGVRSEKLAEFGIQPFRGRPRKEKPEAPEGSGE